LGDIQQSEEGEFYYTEYTMENPRSIKVDDLPEECKKVVLKVLKEKKLYESITASNYSNLV